MRWHTIKNARHQGYRFLAVLTIMLYVPAVAAQPSKSEHEKHHPKSPKDSPKDSPKSDGPGMMKGMGKMMEKMGAPKPRDLYPSLMRLPDLPHEKRAEIQAQAHERMKSGAVLMVQGVDALSKAAPTEDFAAMQEATATLREGLSQFESGLAAHRALAEGKAPRSVALQWFKREMNLMPPGSEPAGGGIFGLSWFHAFTMLLLIAFAIAMIAMYFLKMRRATVLLQRLVADDSNDPSDTKGSINSNGVGAVPSSGTGSPTTSPDKTSPAPLATSADTPSQDCCDDSDVACSTEEEVEGDEKFSGLLRTQKRKLCRLRVARIDQETSDVKTFRFVACHDGGIPFNYLPGQFLTLTLPVGEKPIRRSYTISSSPTQGYYCEITVKREEHGAGSRYLHDHVKVGDAIEAQAPSGKFVFSGKGANSIVLMAGGVGITPMMSISRALTDMSWDGDIHFVVICRDPDHFIFESELKRLRDRHPNLHLHVAMSRLEDDVEDYHRGRLSRELLAEWVPDIASQRVHVCGPRAMMDAVKQMLSELEVPAENVHTENFGGEHKPRVRAEERAKIAESEVAVTGGTVTFNKSLKSTPLQSDETVLEASERIGVDIDFSCRVGTCGVCTVKLQAGEVTMDVDDGLDPEDEAAGMILACQAKSIGDVAVDA